jgi:GMP synthase (glutamine-hydrolysing)
LTRTAVAVRHVAFEDLGLLAGVLSDQGFVSSYVDAPVADQDDWAAAADADLLIVLGGPIGVADVDAYPFLSAELELLRERLAADGPTLGICLGAQLMAVALGGSVTPGVAAEVGFAPVALSDAGRGTVLEAIEGVPVLHWHGDLITTPPELPPLAFTPACANQAFALGHNLLGLQFHLEADSDSLERWLVGHAFELGARGLSVEQLREDAASYGAQLAASAERVFSGWLSALSFERDWGRPSEQVALGVAHPRGSDGS